MKILDLHYLFCFSKTIVFKAVKVAIMVGVILAFINHDELILSGNITSER